MPSPTPDELARQLIDLVRETSAPEAVLLQKRITATLAYLHDVTRPNVHTVRHVRKFLIGLRDDELDFWVGAFNETEGN